MSTKEKRHINLSATSHEAVLRIAGRFTHDWGRRVSLSEAVGRACQIAERALDQAENPGPVTLDTAVAEARRRYQGGAVEVLSEKPGTGR